MQTIYDILGSVTGISISSFGALCLLSFLTSAVSAAFGLGGGAALVAVMATILPPISVIPVHAAVQVASNFFRGVIMLRHVAFLFMPSFVLGTLFGATVGGQIVFSLPKSLLQTIIGIFIIYAVWGPKVKALQPSKKSFVGIGFVASFATMFAGATGPLIAPFIKAATTDRLSTVATHAAFMSWQHGIKIFVFGFLGFAFGPYIPLIILMILFGVLGTWFGKVVLESMPEQMFRQGFNLILTILALRLLYEAAIQDLF